MSKLHPIESAPKTGAFLIYAPDENGRKPYSAGNSNFSVMFRSPSMSLIDAHFHYDMPKPTHWAPLPELERSKP